MIAGASSGRARTAPGPVSASRVLQFAGLVFCGVLPLLTLVVLFTSAIQDDKVAMDFRQFHAAAEVIRAGGDPYSAQGLPLTAWGGPYPYPPLPALAAVPLTPFSLQTSGLMVMGVLVAVALAIPFVLGVRDWRCFGLLLLWPPVISAIQTGNVTLLLALLSALAWRWRNRPALTAASVGVAFAAKLFLWPLAVWLAATRRYWSACLASVFGAAVLLGSWAVIRFSGLLDYPDLLRRLERAVGEDSYTGYIVGLDVGLPSEVARSLWLVVGLSILAGAVVLGRRGDERSSFVLAISAALALTPIVWLHYFALLVVVAAIAQPRLGVVWFVPFGMVVTPGSGHPTPFETAWTLCVAGLLVVLALRATRGAAARQLASRMPEAAAVVP